MDIKSLKTVTLQPTKSLLNMKPIRIILILVFAVVWIAIPCADAEDKTEPAEKKDEHSIAISEQMDDVIIQEATKVKEEFQQKVRSLYDRHPLDWNFDTLIYLYQVTLSLPGKIPVFTRFVIEQSRVLGVIGSILVLVFIAAVLYSLIGQRRVMGWVEDRVEPLSAFIPEATYPFVMSGIRVVVSALIPLLPSSAVPVIECPSQSRTTSSAPNSMQMSAVASSTTMSRESLTMSNRPSSFLVQSRQESHVAVGGM